MPGYKSLLVKVSREKLVLIRFLSVGLSFVILSLITNTYKSEEYGEFLGFNYSVILVSLLFSESFTNTFLIKYIEIKKIKIYSLIILLFIVALMLTWILSYPFAETFLLLIYIFFSKYTSIILRFRNLHEMGFFFENTLRNFIFILILLIPLELSLMTKFLLANIAVLMFFIPTIIKYQERNINGFHFYELPRRIILHQTIFGLTGRGMEILPITILGYFGSYGYVVILEIVSKFTRLIAFPLASYAYEFAIKVKRKTINFNDYKIVQKKSLISALVIFVISGLILSYLLYFELLGSHRIVDVIVAFLLLGLAEIGSSYAGPSGIFLNMSERFRQIYLARLVSSLFIFGLILDGGLHYVVALIALSKISKNLVTYSFTRRALCLD